MDSNMKREIILDNYSHPFNRGTGGDEYIKVNSNNESCIDNIDLYIKFNDGIIEDASKYYLLTKEDLSGMGLDKISIDDGYIVSYDTEEIIYVRGFESEGKTYYKLSETKDLNFKD